MATDRENWHRTEGVWGAVLLPFKDSGEIDETALFTQVDTLHAAGVNGVYALGTAGEFHVLTEAEVNSVAALVADRSQHLGMRFQIGICDSNPRRSLDRAKRLANLGATALQVVLPDWVVPTNQESIDFLHRIAEAAGPTPLVLYNPPHAKRHLAIDDLRTIVDAVPEIVGVKLLDGDAKWYDQIKPLFDRISVFIPGHHMVTGVLAGAHGSYSNVACLSPTATVAWWRLIRSDPNKALEIERQINALFGSVVMPMLQRTEVAPYAFDKALAAIGGWAPIDETVRWPYRSLPADEISLLDRAISAQLGDFLALGGHKLKD